jgi:hypothetical protein
MSTERKYNITRMSEANCTLYQVSRPVKVSYRTVKNGKVTGRVFTLGRFNNEAEAQQAVDAHVKGTK